MADAYQKACPPGSAALVADLSTLPGGASVTIRNPHASVDLYLGGSDVASTTGLVVPAGKAVSMVLDGGETVYGRSSNTTVTLTVQVFRSNFPAIHDLT